MLDKYQNFSMFISIVTPICFPIRDKKGRWILYFQGVNHRD